MWAMWIPVHPSMKTFLIQGQVEGVWALSWEALGSHGKIKNRAGQLWSHVSKELERRDWRLGGQGEGWGEGGRGQSRGDGDQGTGQRTGHCGQGLGTEGMWE